MEFGNAGVLNEGMDELHNWTNSFSRRNIETLANRRIAQMVSTSTWTD